MRKPTALARMFIAIALSAIAGPGISAPLPGARVEIQIPIRDIGEGASSGWVLSTGAVPSWIDVLPLSELGPLSLQEGGTNSFLLQLEYLPGIPTTNGEGEIQFLIAASSSPAATCRLFTQDYFVTTALQCDDADGEPLARPRLPDTLAPSTTIEFTVTPYTDGGGGIYMQAGSSLALVAVDLDTPTVTPSGVAGSFYRFGSSGGHPSYSSPIAPPSSGEHVFEYYSVDAAGNAEAISSVLLKVDGHSPVTTAHRDGYSESLIGKQYFDPGIELGFTAADSTLGVSAGLSRTVTRVDSADFVEITSTETLALTDGFHVVEYLSIDNVENAESPRRLFAFVGVEIDTSPPITAAAFIGEYAVHPSSVSMSTETVVGFTSTDTAQGYATGTAAIFLLIDRSVESCGAPLSAIVPDSAAPQGTCENPVYTSTFTLSRGTHTILFFGIDRVDNEEAAHVLYIQAGIPAQADTIPPQSQLIIGTPVYGTDPAVISTRTPLGFLAMDDEVAVGDGLGTVAAIYYGVNGGAYAQYASSVTITTEGLTLLAYYALDSQGNPEAVHYSTLAVDATPPAATLNAVGSLVTITASDPTSGGVSAGVAEILYFVDYQNPAVCNGVTIDTAAPRGTCENPFYSGPFNLSFGPHTITITSIDNVGNKQMQTLTLEISEQHEFGGVGIGVAPDDTIWSVARADGEMHFAHYDGAGTLISSVPLLGASGGLPWSVFFDPGGRAYAVGGAEGEGTQAADVAVYIVSATGDSIESSVIFDGGLGKNDYVFDAKAPGWITGVAQFTGETQSEDGPPEGEYSMALWRFEPALGTVVVSTTYARGGFAIGAGIGLDPDGSLWIVGYSLNPDSPSTGFDLSLWHYASDGQTLIAGPFHRPGYLHDLDGGITARIHVAAGVVYVAAPKAASAGGTDMAFLAFDKTAGAWASEKVWRADAGAAAYPGALLPEASNLLVTGGIGGEFSQAALWRFGYDGGFQSAMTANAGEAAGAAFRGGQLWLSVNGSTAPYRVQSESTAAGALTDTFPPRTSLIAGNPATMVSSAVYVASTSLLGFTSVDDRAALNDVLGVGATQTFYAIDGGGYALFASSFSIASEGMHAVSFYSVDREGNSEAAQERLLGMDATAPVAHVVSSAGLYAIEAEDPTIGGAASGVALIQYLVDVDPETCDEPQNPSAPSGTCANLTYAGPFVLSAGTHAVHFAVEDRLGNGAQVVNSSFVVVASSASPAFSLVPSSGPIGVPFTISGTGFGAYAGANTRVKFGVSTAPISVWNDLQIKGTIPGLSTGAYAVTVERQAGSTVTTLSTLAFEVTALAPAALSVSSGPIGIPFTFTGPGFGPYAGSNTRVLVAGATAPISVWNDLQIKGTIPGVSTGPTTIVVERRTADGGVSASAPFAYEVTAPSVAAVTPSSAPIGAPFTVSGQGFGPYAGSNTRVLIGGATAPISVWNEVQIKGTVPGTAAPGDTELIVERRSADGGVVQSAALAFRVAGLMPAPIAPSSGPVGVPFTINGEGFGPYAGANTRVRFGVSTAAISVWNDLQIKGTVPGLSTGAYAVAVERQQGVDISVAFVSTFTLTELIASVVTPSSAPAGAPFTIDGAGFGPYAGANTRVLIGGTTAPISVWNDLQIKGTVPGGASGLTTLVIERSVGAFVQASASAAFEVLVPDLASVEPSSGPIGIAFTLSGSGFGPYAGANTRVVIGGVSAAISVWNDVQIKGTIPALSTGTHDLAVERLQGGFVSASSTRAFTVAEMVVAGVAPSSAPIGAPITLTGGPFGAYAGANTRLLIGGATCAVSVWNDVAVKATVPALPAGTHALWVERKSGAGVQSSATTYFEVLTPGVASLTPSSAPIGAPFTITGSGFGPYAGANTRVTFGGLAAPISVWNDVTIKGTVPGAAAVGATEVVVERVSGAGLSQSATQAFEVLVPAISTIAPSYGTSGTVVTVSGHGFGPYAGANTRLLVGGSTVAVSVWNDATIRWTVPAWLSDGDYPVVVRRTPAGGTVDSASATFTVGTSFGGASFGFGAQSLAAQPDQNFEGLLNLSAEEGGRVETPAKAAVELPPNAMDEDKELSVKRARGDGYRSQAADQAKVRAAGEPIEFGPEGTRFNAPVWIELPYDPALTPDESKVAIHYYDPLRRAWDALPSVVDRVRRVVRAQTDHFSIYQPMAIGVTTAAQDEFYLRDYFAYPNPVRGGLVTFRVQPGLADTVEVRVYDVAGRKVYSSSDFAHTAPGGEHQYENIWNVSGVGSGVYTYAIRASRAGQKTISKTGKVGVIK